MTVQTMPSTTARKALTRFVTTLYAEGDLIEVRPIELWHGPGGKRSRPLSDARQWLHPTEIVRAFDELWAINLTERGNIFMGVNPRTRVGGGTKADVAICRSVWAELDRMSLETATRWRQLALPSPTVVVASGGGAHLYWMLEEPLSVQEPNVRSRFEAMLKALYTDLKCDSTSDVSRLLRLPGFWNVKDFRLGSRPRECRLVHCNGDLRYPLSQFERWFEKSEEQAAPVPVAAVAPAGDDARIQQLVARLDIEVPDRSARDFAIVCELLRLGLTREGIWPLVQGKSKFSARGREYFERTVYNAAFYCNRLYSL
jgi:hypothetical protein